MSGPKSSRYTVTATRRRMLAEQRQRKLLEQQQKILEEQRRIEQERKENCIWIKNTVGQMQKSTASFDRELAVAQELAAKSKSDHGMQQVVQNVREKVQRACTLAQNVESKDAAYVKAVLVQVNQVKAEIVLLQQKIQLAAQENEKELGRYFGSKIADAFSEKNDVPDAPTEKMDKSTDDVKAEINDELAEVMAAQSRISRSLFERAAHAKVALDELQDEEHLKNFEAITVLPLFTDYRKEVHEYEAVSDAYLQARASYEALCQSAAVEPKETSCCQAGLEMLQKEIERLQLQLAEDDERAYISQSIDEVMAEMSYDVIGQRQVHKKNGRHFTNELYAYEDGMAVNVTYADDGKITMELGGLDTDDRLPGAAEAKQLCESMESFCDDFSEIEKRLEAKGVVLKSRLALLPPSEDYAQIINVSDYQTTVPIDTFKANNRRRSIGQGKERYSKE